MRRAPERVPPRRLPSALCIFLLGAALGAPAAAQTPVVQPERLPALGRSVAGTDDSTALLLNPANLGFLPGPELRWQSIFLQDDLVQPWQGHALSLAFRLPFSLATGVRLDLLSPPSGAFAPGFTQSYQWLTWGLAYAPTRALSVGASLQRSYGNNPIAASLGSYSLATTLRPSDHLGFSFVAHHVNGPLSGPEDMQRLADLGIPGVSLGSSFDTALAVRPLGTRAVELGLEAKYLAEPEIWVPRATVGIDLPPVGRLIGDFAMSNPTRDERAWVASAALSIFLNAAGGSTALEGGALTGDGLGQDGSYNFHSSLAFRGFREPAGVEPKRYGARIRIEDTPGTRGHVALLRRLWSLADEDNVDAVVFELRTGPAASLARVEELRDALYHLRRRGKRVLCHLEDAGGSSLYLCSAANRILINPGGGLRFAGLRTRHFYFAGLLDKLGVRAEFVRIGPHKSAPERFTREGPTDVARQDSIDLLQQHERQLVSGVSHGRRIDPQALRERIATGPFIAGEALEAGLVDGLAFDDQIQGEVDRLVGRSTPLHDDRPAPIAPEKFSTQRRVALVYVDGDIVDGRSRTIPLIGMDLVGSYTIAETLKQVREDPRIAAVVLRVESPGGSSMASDVMWRAVQQTAETKPVIVSMGSYAASGGYYIAAPATRIFANPLTITGSIGIFYGKADVSGLLSKIGVNVQVYKTAPRADAESLFRPFTEEERRELERKVGQFYDLFLTRVAAGRSLSKEAVDAVAQGRVWTGIQAQSRGLVDELGGLRQALEHARRVAGLPEDAPLVELPPRDRSLLGRLLGVDGLQAGHDAVVLPPQVLPMLQALAPFMVHPADKPLARLEAAPLVP